LTEFRLENIKTGLTLFGRINNNGFMDTNVPFLDKIVPLIVSLVSPDQIVLFGSYARGDNTEKSDIDLLIIKKNLNNAKIITDNLYMSFFDNKIKIPVDLIVVDYDKYNYLKNEIGYIYKTINEEGKLIYGTV
jgi:predicted nucleotidyltransferase